MSVISERPHFSEQEAEGLARELYGLTVSAQALPSERDQNFLLRQGPEAAFVLKIANGTEERAILDLQNKAMSHVSARSRTKLCAMVRPSLAGEEITTVKGANGSTHLVRLLTYLPGRPLGKVNPHSPELLHSLGSFFGALDNALADFTHPAMYRELYWDLKQAAKVIQSHIEHVSSPERRAIIHQFWSEFERCTLPRLPSLRTGVIHGDGNDYNILVSDDPSTPSQAVIGVIDYGDMLHTYTICELAIVLAYAMLDKEDPLAAAVEVIGGYHAVFPITEAELAVLFNLACIRLCMSVSICAYHQKLEPDNEYLKISERPAWRLLEQLSAIPAALAHYTFRHACGLPPCPKTGRVVDWLVKHRNQLGPVIRPDLKTAPKLVFDLSVGGLLLGRLAGREDVSAFTQLLFGEMAAAGAEVGIGRYDEARQIYSNDLFKTAAGERRTIHLGLDLFVEAGSPVFAPLDGTIHSFQDNTTPLDYGPTIIIEHRLDEGETFYTLYGHLSRTSLETLYEGQPVKKGDPIGWVGSPPQNGNWPPHLHFQLITDLLGRQGEFPGVAAASGRAVWLSLCPDPNLVLDLPVDCFPPAELGKTEILETRARHLGRSLSISYKKPLKIVRGFRQYLYDETGQAYLDAVNNVAHVGHCHPKVVQAGQAQMAVLNTNTRYLHDNLAQYARQLCATLPEPLQVCFFVCTGSEANDLALRLARIHTQQTDIIVVDGAYHGNLTSLVEISPYKFDGPGGKGAPPYVHKLPMPDGYRGPYKNSDPQAGEKYAQAIGTALNQLRQADRGVAAFICESLLSCGGQIVLPEGYLQAAYRQVREAGGVCIADEVQVGFGRVGSHFWGFETQGVVPDIVTLGKPIGNGHPLAAVITTPEIATSFNNGMEYFNTFGGNPVSCAIGLAVLEVIREERLQENALKVGSHLKQGLERLKPKHPLIGDVRGLGLFLGIEFVLDQETLEPAAAQAAYIVERMKAHGILLSTDGPLHNVIKIKPPLVFTEADTDFLVTTLDKVLTEDFVRR
jgi:4-aminobutyrate aminotransferase-like enzyme/Ser/Thr protein kinase RdoA (MazF antagonist)